MRHLSCRSFLGFVACAVLAPSVLAAATAAPAATVYYGGDILTMVGEQPSYVAALAVRDGRIVYAGSRQGALKAAGSGARRVDLKGHTLLPGFIDAHGHIVDYTTTWSMPNLSPPPVGDVRSIEDIKSKLRAYIARENPPRSALLLANGYDDGLLAEKRHPTRADLDEVSRDIPIGLLHASGHLITVNSAALAKAGITRDTPDPPGGLIRHDAAGEPNGVMEEQAGQPFLGMIVRPEPAEQMRRLRAVQKWYASYGLTTAQDGLSYPENVDLLRRASAQDALLIDIVSYPAWLLFDKFLKGEAVLSGIEHHPPGSLAANAGILHDDSTGTPAAAVVPRLGDDARAKLKVGVYVNHFKIGGIKITSDGSPQGKTAFMTQPYLHPPAGQPADYRGYPTLPQDELDAWLAAAYQYDFQVLVHANGDAAIDSLLTAVGRARAKFGPKDLRPVAIHAQLARHDQVDAMKALGVVPSFFTAHTYFWGDWHINETFGQGRAFGISPLRYADSIGLVATNHNDSPVVPPDMMMLTWTAVNRLSRSGVVVGPDARVTPYQALKAITSAAAYQYFEESSKGTLEPGKRADLVILAANPVKADPLAIKDIAVLETIKDGKTVFDAREPRPAGPGY